MDEAARREYDNQSQTLRAELKTWETSWAKTHKGQKPSRDDIKQNPDIAQKYKSYNKLRDILSGKLPPPAPTTTTTTSSTTATRKRKSTTSSSTTAPSHTPSKRARTAPTATPLNSRHPSDVNPPTTTPSLNRKLFPSPTVVPTPTSVGPTPQRDGRVLGIFDLLSGSEETPSRPRTGDFLAPTGLPTEPAATPRKNTSSPDHHADGSGSTLSPRGRRRRTPMSTSKRALLDNFLLTTPLKSRSLNSSSGVSGFAARIGITTTSSSVGKENAPADTTTPREGPSSVSKTLFATPAFLKRGCKPLDGVSEEEDVRPLRLPRRKPLVRGLSSVVADLRRIEEERLDEEMEVMREAEMEAEEALRDVETEVGAGGGGGGDGAVLRKEGGMSSEPGKPAVDEDGQVVEVEDGQVKPVLLGAFDDEGLYDGDEGVQLDRGQPLRVYKKKGQKRTTRRVNMRPTRTRRPVAQTDGGESEKEEEEEDELVPETQFDAAKGGESQDDGLGPLSGSEFSQNEEDDEPKKKKKKAKKDGEKEMETEGTVKKVVRKVKATAHANFKRLKLRNYGAKGGPGHNSRFKRRR